MQFCPACDNKLYLQIHALTAGITKDKPLTQDASAVEQTLTLYCKHCPFTQHMHESAAETIGAVGTAGAGTEGGAFVGSHTGSGKLASTRELFDPCMFRSNYSSNHPLFFSTKVNAYTKYDPTLPCLTTPCANQSCISNTSADIESAVLLIRYNDRDQAFLYLCKHCNQCWKVDNDVPEVLFDFSDATTRATSAK